MTPRLTRLSPPPIGHEVQSLLQFFISSGADFVCPATNELLMRVHHRIIHHVQGLRSTGLHYRTTVRIRGHQGSRANQETFKDLVYNLIHLEVPPFADHGCKPKVSP